MCLTRYSTPVPELDDHRSRVGAPPQVDDTPERGRITQDIVQHGFSTDTPQRPDLFPVQNARREAGTQYRDFEQAVVDDEPSGVDGHTLGRHFSIDHADNIRHGRRASRTQQDHANRSRETSVSARSTSPPNSVEAFADPRRRERANTLESHMVPDLDTILQRTVSAGTNPRRPTFSNASAVRPHPADIQLDSTDDVGVPLYDQPGKIPVIDYEELEEFVAMTKKTKPAATRRKHSLSSQSKNLRTLGDVRSKDDRQDSNDMHKASTLGNSSSDGLESHPAEKSNGHLNEKELLESLQNENEPTRFGFFSSESQSTVHASELGDLVLPGDSFRDLFQLGPEGGVWWLDVVNPSEEEVGALARAFSIHPLTTEDIMMQEDREKVELFKQYYFVCFRTFYQLDKTSDQFLDPVNFYMVVYRDGVITFSFSETRHAANVRKRIGKLREYVSLSSDWICYAMM